MHRTIVGRSVLISMLSLYVAACSSPEPLAASETLDEPRSLSETTDLCDSLRFCMETFYDSFGDCLSEKLAQGYDIDSLCTNELPILATATAQGRVEAVRLLLAAGADVNKSGRASRRPVHSVFQSGEVATQQIILDLFLDHGAEINPVDDGGHTLLSLAAQNDETEFVQLLLDYGAKIVTPKFSDIFFASPDSALQIARADAFMDINTLVRVKDWERGAICILCFESADVAYPLCDKHTSDWKIWTDGRIEHLQGVADLYLNMVTQNEGVVYHVRAEWH